MGRKRLDSVSEFARQGYNLRFTCDACGHEVIVDAVALRRKLLRRKLEGDILAVEQRARCSRCRKRRARVTATMAKG